MEINILRVTLFHDLVANELGRQPTYSSSAQAVHVVPNPSSVRLPSQHLPVPGPSSEYLEVGHVREIVNRASYLTQCYGTMFNAHFSMCSSDFGVQGEAAACGLIERFCNDLANAFSETEGTLSFASLAVLEHRVEGVTGLVLAHIPVDAEFSAQQNVDRWLRKWSNEAAGSEDVVCSRYAFQKKSLTARQKFHWDNVRLLCRALVEDVEVHDSESGHQQSLLRLLGIREHKPDGPLSYPRLVVSELLQDAAVFGDPRMLPLSAFDDGSWSWISKGWEFDEYEARKRLMDERNESLERLRQIHADDPTALEEAVRRHQSALSNDPKDRRRHFQLWFSSEVA